MTRLLGLGQIPEENVSDLGRLSPALPADLTAALKDDKLEVREAAAYSLGHFGPATLPALTEALRDEDAEVRRAEADSLDTRSMEKKRTITLRQIGVIERISRAGVTITWEDGERDTIPLDHLPAECVCHPRGQRVEAIVQRAESSFEVLKVLHAQSLPPLAQKTEGKTQQRYKNRHRVEAPGAAGPSSWLIVSHEESGNRFADAICLSRGQEYPYAEKTEQELADGCNRLIRNAIVCWNYLYLSQVLAEEPAEDRRQALLAALRQGSIVLWHHLNLHGEYDFSEEKLQDSVGLDLSRILAVEVP